MLMLDYHPGPRVICGPNAIDRLGELAREIGAARSLVVSDPGIVQAGHVDRALRSLAKAAVTAATFCDVASNPTTRHVEAALAIAREFSPDLIVGLGGGSALDCARGVNFLLTNGGRMSDYWGVGKAPKAMLPMIGIPTTAGTGSEMQSFALIADDTTHQKMACGDRKAMCRIAILDPVLTMTQPAAVAASAGIDAVAHAVESYVSGRHTLLSRMFAREAWRLLYASFPQIVADPEDLEARAAVQLGAALAGTAIENSMLGAAHSCANPLTARYDIPHGLAVGVMLPHVITFNGPAAGPLYIDLLVATCDAYPDYRNVAFQLANVVRMLLRVANLPASLEQLGVPLPDLSALAAEAAKQWTVQFNPRPVSEADLLELYRQAYPASPSQRPPGGPRAAEESAT